MPASACILRAKALHAAPGHRPLLTVRCLHRTLTMLRSIKTQLQLVSASGAGGASALLSTAPSEPQGWGGLRGQDTVLHLCRCWRCGGRRTARRRPPSAAACPTARSPTASGRRLGTCRRRWRRLATEGPAWRVLHARGQACEAQSGEPFPKCSLKERTHGLHCSVVCGVLKRQLYNDSVPKRFCLTRVRQHASLQ